MDSPTQLNSTLARDLSRSFDPCLLMADAGFAPDLWQADALRSEAKRQAWLCCRQSGKSTTAAAKAAWTAVYQPESLTVILSPSLRQSAEVFRTTANVVKSVEGMPNMAAESALRFELPNGSRVVSLPASDSTVRGFTPDLVILDEAAHCEDELIHAVLPMLVVSDGQLIALTTPAGCRGWFYQTWNHDETFEKTKIAWRNCPRISVDAVDLYRRTAGELMYRQEFCCEFLEADNLAVFPAHLIDAMFSDEVATLCL